MSELTPLKAIKLHCIECSGGVRAEVRNCPIKHCVLFEFRNGHKPKSTNIPPAGDAKKNPNKMPYFLRKKLEAEGRERLN